MHHLGRRCLRCHIGRSTRKIGAAPDGSAIPVRPVAPSKHKNMIKVIFLTPGQPVQITFSRLTDLRKTQQSAIVTWDSRSPLARTGSAFRVDCSHLVPRPLSCRPAPTGPTSDPQSNRASSSVFLSAQSGMTRSISRCQPRPWSGSNACASSCAIT